jgi:hypothetical protein
MSIIGLLPASGKAERILGLPKFAIPISDKETLISWHVKMLKEVCDDVIITTRREWVPILELLELPAKIVVKEPSTLSNTIRETLSEVKGSVFFGMPDTAILGNSVNPYVNLLNCDREINLGLFNCPPSLMGKVGQVLYKEGEVRDVVDKIQNCNYPHMWGNIFFRNYSNQLDLGTNTPSTEINNWIRSGVSIGGVFNDGQYFDVGSFEGLKELLIAIKNESGDL